MPESDSSLSGAFSLRVWVSSSLTKCSVERISGSVTRSASFLSRILNLRLYSIGVSSNPALAKTASWLAYDLVGADEASGIGQRVERLLDVLATSYVRVQQLHDQ